MTVTSTYDHRIIQGAESGLFLARMEELLKGEDGFYERIFEDLGLPHRPVRGRWTSTPASSGPPAAARRSEKQARVLQLIHAYRVRGHLVADLDPLDSQARAPPRPRPRDLRPHALGPRPRVHHERPLRQGQGHAPGDPRGPARDLLRHDRRRVHVHRRPRAEGLAPGADGVRAELPGPRRGEQEARPGEAGGGGELRALPAREVRRPQALLARGRRGAHPPPRPHPERRAPSEGVDGGRDRHAPPRPPQRARQHGGQAAGPDLLGVRGQTWTPTPPRARAT